MDSLVPIYPRPPAAIMTARKVLEVMPRLHQAVTDVAHDRRAKVRDLATVLVAYAMEHIDDALHEADRLMHEWEGPPEDRPTWAR